jgi:hypothetical protein
MSGMLLFASRPSALTRYRAVRLLPSSVVTVHRLGVVVEDGAGHLGVQLDVPAEVVPVDDVLEVSQDVGLVEVAGVPVPLLQQVLVEGVAVDEALGVGLGARVLVEVPGAADAAALLEGLDGQATLVAQLVQHVDAAESGADDDGVDVGCGHGAHGCSWKVSGRGRREAAVSRGTTSRSRRSPRRPRVRCLP